MNMIAFVATLKHEKYMFNAKASEFQLIKIWNEEHLQPCAIQTIVKDVTIGFKHTPQIILAQNVFEKGSIVFIMGNRLHYGRKATIVNNCGLDSNERVSGEYRLVMHSAIEQKCYFRFFVVFFSQFFSVRTSGL